MFSSGLKENAMVIYWLIFMATEKWEIGDYTEGTSPVNLEVA